MRRANPLAVVDLSGGEHTIYDVVLLAGSPRRSTLALGPDLVEGAMIEVDGQQWTVADVRITVDGRPQLICIYAV